MFGFKLIVPFVGLAAAQLWAREPNGYHPNPHGGQGFEVPTWPESNVGQPLQPQTPDAELQAMLSEVDPQRIQNTIATLAAFGTRHTLSNQTDPNRGIGAARDWLYHQMQGFAQQSNGNMDVYLNSYIQPVASRISFPVNISNVVAEVKGSSDPNRVYVVTGHYDSRRIDVMDYTNDAPGADDDASGVAGKPRIEIRLTTGLSFR